MATIINNPRPVVDRRDMLVDRGEVESRSGAGFVLGVLAAIILGILLLAYAVPALRNGRGRSVNVPNKVNLDVNGSGSTTTNTPTTSGTTAQ
ncbi:MAG: hypothetical protein NVSMB66_4680 [Candidatus Doudnabacteria bacterium]